MIVWTAALTKRYYGVELEHRSQSLVQILVRFTKLHYRIDYKYRLHRGFSFGACTIKADHYKNHVFDASKLLEPWPCTC